MTTTVEEATIGSRLAGVARRLPGKAAIVEGDVRLPYAQLDARATAVATRVAAAAGSREGPVCLLFESKLVAIAAIFGASRAGRTYVPLDAGDPDDRLRFILADSAPVVLLTESSLRDRAKVLAPPGCAIVDVGDSASAAAVSAGALPQVPATATVYRYYTSGSTGKPKGVDQTHCNLLFFVDAYVAALDITEADRVSLLYTLSFSGANMDIFGALANGATLCPYDVRRHGVAQLADWLDRERVTVLHCVPTLFRELMNRLSPERKLIHLRAIDLGGEAVFDSDVALFVRHTKPHCVLVNHLAATEASVVAQNVIDHAGAREVTSILPVGRSPAGVRVVIEREDGGEADVDEVGEIVVCSRHVSPGYFNRPELNAAAFADDPAVPGLRRYITGDVGRIDAAGNLHFIGRKGTRIKLRGHSIDLNEIEGALCAYPGVTKAAVLALPGEARAEPDKLVAYLAIDAKADRDAGRVRRHLAEFVPSYMLPASFVFLDELPLLSSGKIDRKTLAQLPPPDSRPGRSVTPPADDVERGVAGIFERLLAVDGVGREDDFFLLGGDSLKGVELQVALREAFGVHVANFHAEATVASIAESVRRGAASAAGETRSIPVLIPLWQGGTAPPLFLIHGKHGQAFVSPQFMLLLGDDQPVWAFQARGLDGLREPHATVEDMAAEYLAEMRKHRPHGPYFLGSLCAGAYVAAVMARALRAAGETVLPLLILDPPSGQPQRDYGQMDEARFARKMSARRAQGLTAGPADDPAYMQALRKTAMAFEDALTRHRPMPYDGPVYVLTSVARMQAGSDGLRTMFTGRFKRYEVGMTHSQALDPRNPVFASTLQRCVGLIREAAQR